MASSGTIWGRQEGTRPRLSIYWRAVRQDVANNRTEIEATLRLHSSYSLNFSASKTGSLDGTAFTYTGGFSGAGQVNLSTKKYWVNHSSDGTKTQSISGNFNIAVSYSGTWLNSLSVSGNMNLERIPRGSTLNSASITALKNGAGSTLSIGRTVHHNGFYHLVTIQDGNTWIWDTGYFSGAPATSYTIPSGYVNKMLNGMSTVTSKSYTVRLRTYSGSGGGGQISEVTRSVTVSVHSDVKPSVNNPSVNISGTGRDKAIGKYVQSFSKVNASVSGSAGYGSSVSAYNITVRRVGGSDSQSISGSSGTTSRPVALSGSYEVIGTITDTRGRSNTSRATFTVDTYSPPSITSFTAVRNGSTQTTVNITRATTHSVLGGGGNNNLSYSVQRRLGTGSWANVNTNGSGTITASPSSATSTSTGNSVTSSYEFRYVVTDQFGGRAESVVSVSTQRVVLDIHKNQGVGIGKIHEKGTLDVDGEIFLRGMLEVDPPTVGDKRPVLKLNSGENNGFGFVEFFNNANVRAGYLGVATTLSGNLRNMITLGADPLLSKGVNFRGSDISFMETPIMEYGTGGTQTGYYVRFYNGLQICWGVIGVNGASMMNVNMASAFKDNNYSLSVTSMGMASGSYYGSFVTEANIVTSSLIHVKKLLITDAGPKESVYGSARYTAIGMWK